MAPLGNVPGHQAGGRMNWKPFVALFIGVFGIGTATAEQSPASRFGRDLAGAWSVQVTLRDCSTTAPLGPPFNSLVSFHAGGTLSESAASHGLRSWPANPGPWHVEPDRKPDIPSADGEPAAVRYPAKSAARPQSSPSDHAGILCGMADGDAHRRGERAGASAHPVRMRSIAATVSCIEPAVRPPSAAASSSARPAGGQTPVRSPVLRRTRHCSVRESSGPSRRA